MYPCPAGAATEDAMEVRFWSTAAPDVARFERFFDTGEDELAAYVRRAVAIDTGAAGRACPAGRLAVDALATGDPIVFWGVVLHHRRLFPLLADASGDSTWRGSLWDAVEATTAAAAAAGLDWAAVRAGLTPENHAGVAEAGFLKAVRLVLGAAADVPNPSGGMRSVRLDVAESMKVTRIGKLVAHMQGGHELRNVYPEEAAAAFNAEVDRLYPEAAGAAASSAGGLSMGLMSQHATCADCGVKEPTPAAYKRCGGCRRVVYCGVACQRSHWTAHKPRCGSRRGRHPDPAAVRAVVFPGDPDLKPYEVWIPGAGGVGDSFGAQAAYLGRALLGGATADGSDVCMERVRRGDPAAMASAYVAHAHFGVFFCIELGAVRGPAAGPHALGAVFAEDTDPALLQSLVREL
ncbi:hypothetical protein I4F81_005926 [Pyropia yezoensis]|uniref:Uncharacterized protein n=1 Tax=Pyropia yezoensis TaxID=2788 RepID=A0ACC3BZT5_PYRYE|nr:hypothetical protein I4F81_005926 [Neopyropia yezoensis]